MNKFNLLLLTFVFVLIIGSSIVLTMIVLGKEPKFLRERKF